jgi:hypothetical protein
MPQWEDEMRRWLYAAISVFSLANGIQAAEPVTPGVPDQEASLEWIYSCPSSKGCAFSCPGAGAATHVTKLTIHLRRLRIDNEQALALFYDYSTMEFPSGSGFSISAGLGTISCQVNGMTLDYMGPPKSLLQN